jgi:hypothetical protein
MDARCPQCGQTIRLPGKLATVATLVRERRKDPLGIGLEVIGFVAMFFFFPWGMLIGAVVVFLGWRKSTALLCGNCRARVKRRSAEKCPECKVPFGTE